MYVYCFKSIGKGKRGVISHHPLLSLKLLFSLGLLLALVGNHTYVLTFDTTRVKATYSDCTKAIEKGVASWRTNFYHFYDKYRLYMIIPTPSSMECLAREFEK